MTKAVTSSGTGQAWMGKARTEVHNIRAARKGIGSPGHEVPGVMPTPARFAYRGCMRVNSV